MTNRTQEIDLLQRLNSDPALLHSLERSLYRDSFYDFVKAAWQHIDPTPFKPNWHIEAICEHLQAQSEGRLQNLIINVPPGSAKSLLAGVLWPCWEWTRNPSVQILATSAEEKLAARDNIKARKLLNSAWYQRLFPIGLEQDQNNALKFTNSHMGFREASPMSSLTGKRANRVIVDDAISASNATSDALRDKVNETFWLNAPSRVNDPAKDTTTIIQQRLHEQDLVGSIIATEGQHWDKLIIPMEYVPTTYVTTIGWKDPRETEGELMFAEHWPKPYLDRIRAQDSYKYASQYQQNPVPDKDAFFDRSWFNRYQPGTQPANLNLYMTSDHSVGGKKTSDYNVFRIWGVDAHKNLWLIASHRTQDRLATALGIRTDEQGRLTVADTGALALARRYKPLAWFAEPDNAFEANRALLVETIRTNGIYVRIVDARHNQQSKEVRAQPFQAMAENGKIYLPNNVIGDTALDEYARFLVSGHDDQVDADAILPRMIRDAHAAVHAPQPARQERDPYAPDQNDDQDAIFRTFF